MVRSFTSMCVGTVGAFRVPTLFCAITETGAKSRQNKIDFIIFILVFLNSVSFLLKNPQNLFHVITHSPDFEEEDNATYKPPNA